MNNSLYKILVTASFSGALFTVVMLPNRAEAHPGNTDSLGGHHCWTNCASWGYEYGEYHFHESKPSFASVYLANLEFIQDTNAALDKLRYAVGDEYVCEKKEIEKLVYDNISNAKTAFDLLSSLTKGLGLTTETYEDKCDASCKLMISDMSKGVAVALSAAEDLSKLNQNVCNVDLSSQINEKIKQFSPAKATSVSSFQSAKKSVTPKKTTSVTTSDLQAASKSAAKVGENMYDRVCSRVVNRFAEDEKMWVRVNERVQKRFGFVCEN